MVVIDGVRLRAAADARCDMIPSTASGRTCVPRSVAHAAGARSVGRVNLADPAEAFTRSALARYGIAPFEIVLYEEVEFDEIDLGVGPVLRGVRALVLDDAHTATGVIGRDALSAREGVRSFCITPDHLYWMTVPSAGG